ncbi:hypothetical protein HAX54_040877 [Datura stramonium]|uniref:Apple domain-containing protein n=1 Tax=Datura stramonium TaxID=4076 RepID=A0ABS8SKU4_DATST|nr:hypothetical protein [Datura stramonium]
MKLGRNFVTGREVYLSSWKNEEDPAPGNFTYHCDPSGYPQNFLKKGSEVVYALDHGMVAFLVGHKTQKKFLSIHLEFLQVRQRFTFDTSSHLQLLKGYIKSECPTTLDLCCNSQDSPVRGCLDKFVPNNSEAWKKTDWSGGCVRRTELNCLQGDIFLKYSHIKLPDTRNAWSNVTMTLEECKNICSKNCSCMAYSNPDIRNGGSGCLLWFEDLLGHCQVGRNANYKMDFSGNRAEEFEIPLFDFIYHNEGYQKTFQLTERLERGAWTGFLRAHEGQEIAVKRLSRTSTQGETGTSPEYALHGQYSVNQMYLALVVFRLETAWNLYKEGRSTELLDECLGDSCSTHEVVRSIRVGLLCVQQCPDDHPSMSSYVSMSNNEGVLP